MLCPNCNQPINLVTVNNQSILHCGNCGGSFFEENVINRISLQTTQKLAEEKQTNEIFGVEKKCPKDGSILKPQTNQENIPADVTLLSCEKCRGIFVYPDDLIRFKQAQEAKINYFKLWQIPLPSLKAVLVISFSALFLATIVTQYNSFLNYFSQRSQASDLIKKVYLSKSGHYLFISFKTETFFRSKIIFEDKTSKQKIEKMINNKPAIIHQLTTGDLNLDDEIYYQIILIDNKGTEIKTKLTRL